MVMCSDFACSVSGNNGTIKRFDCLDAKDGSKNVYLYIFNHYHTRGSVVILNISTPGIPKPNSSTGAIYW